MNEVFLSLFSALRLSTPLTFAALGGYMSERAGIVNIGLEGMMLIGSFTAAVVANATHNPWLGLLGGIAGGMSLALVHGFLTVKMRADQIISGMAVNLLAAGIPPVVCKVLYDMSGGTPVLEARDRLHNIAGLSPLVVLAVLFSFILWFVHARTKYGQYIRFAGEHPQSLESQGVSVQKVRMRAVLVSGALCGLAGTYLSIEHGSGFARNMTAGRGFIALAALILGRWTPLGAFIAALIFGGIEASQILLQGMVLGSSGKTVPVQFIQMIPYVTTLVILAGLVGGKNGMRVPKALGKSLTTIAVIILGSSLLTGCNEFKNDLLVKLHIVKKEEEPQAVVDSLKPEDKEKAYAEFIRELVLVTVRREVKQEEFERLLNVLTQGGHYEGLYNGIVYSDEYRAKEQGLATAGSVKIYSDIMAELTMMQKYDPIIQDKLKQIVKPDVPKPQDERVVVPKPGAKEKEELQAAFEKEVLDKGLSVFTLKKKIGEEIIRTVDLKKTYREKLASWYASFTIHLNSFGVDFGLPQRNMGDEYFHYRWALKADEDLVKWECLNRVHRLVNSKY